jgi:hypothetical protein
MGNLVENFEKNPITTGIGESEWGLSKNKESKLKDLKHLELANEWLKKNGNGSQLNPLNYLMNEFFEPGESVKNWRHLEMAYEWLRNRGKIAPLILKRRIWWEPVPKAISYVVYVSQDRSIFLSRKFKMGSY